MALLYTSRKLCLNRLFISQGKIDYLKFHTLRKIDFNVIAKTIPTKITIPKRSYFWVFRKRTRREIKLVDKPPNNYELIYRSGMDNYFFAFQHLGFYGAVTLCLIAVYKSQTLHNLPAERREKIDEDPYPRKRFSDDDETLLIISAFFLLYCALYYVINRMPVRIYCYPQQKRYLLYFYGVVPNQIQKLAITAGEITYKPSKSVLPWSHEIYEHKETGQVVFLLEEYFKCPADLLIMLGLQKDSDVNYDDEKPDKPKE